MIQTSLLGILAAGVLTFLSPCILPLMPLYLSHVTGNADQHRLTFRDSLLISLGFVLGLMTVFSLFGLTATALGRFVNLNGSVFRRIGGIVIILFGLHHMGAIRLPSLGISRTLKMRTTRNLFLNALLLGIIFSFGWTPCIGPVLASILILLAGNAAAGTGILYMVVFSLGLAIPFILTTFLMGRVFDAAGLSDRTYRIIRVLTGLVMVAIGLMVFFNTVNRIILYLT